jgi:hypothetical protein
MPVYHVHASYIKKGQGSAADFSRYIAREGRGEASQMRRYLERERDGSGKDDLVAHGSGNLPDWTHGSAALFWEAADVLERKNSTVSRQIEIALPRELSPQGREELAADIREVLMGTQFAHSWAIHEPMARDGSGIMPHMHLMFSPRRQDDDQARTMAQWFKQVNHGGVRPDASWKTKGRLYDVRAAVALLSNAALAREGIEAAVDHRSLEARGLSRDPARYEAGNRADEARTQDYRQLLRDSGVTAYEQLHTYAGWQDQAVKLLSLDLQYIKDLARDHVWRYDQSPARQVEREQSMQRTLDLAMGERQPTHTLERTHAPAQERTYERTTGRDLADQLQDLAARLEQLDEPHAGAALRVKLWEREERDRGYGLGL